MCVFVWEFVSILVDNEFGFLEFYVKFFTQVGQTIIIVVIIKFESFFEPEEVGMKHGGKFCRRRRDKETKNIRLFFLFAPHFFANRLHMERRPRIWATKKTKQTDQTHFHPTTLLNCLKSGVQTIVCVFL